MLTKDEWQKLRDMINAWPDDSDRINMHRVINRELAAEAVRTCCQHGHYRGTACPLGTEAKEISDAAAQFIFDGDG